jgi:GT2 family glycosyltransferase
MPYLHAALIAAAWLIALAWLFKLLEAVRGLPTIPNLLDPAYDRTPAGNPSLTVIVPARNEAPAIAATLHSLIAQDYPSLHILAVDDRSTDSTGALIDTLAAAHPHRITALHITELPPNWLGKPHAMSVAAQYAIEHHNPGFLLFTDADILFAPTILRRALTYAVETQAAHLVALPTTIIKTRGEAMILSFLQVMSFFAVRPWRIANPRARDAIGVGAFNLIRASAYLHIGGFAATPMEIVEDLALGRRVKAAGLPQRIATAPAAVTVHWAAGLFGIVNNMTKNLFAIFRFQPVLLLLGSASLATFCVGPAVFLFLPATMIPAAITFASAAGLYTLSARTSRISSWNAALLPISAALLIYSMLRSMVITLKQGGVTWRGTFYPLSELRERSKTQG